MLIKTKFHGETEVSDTQVIHFKKGILGFESHQSFVILEMENHDVLKVLQSTHDEQVAFVIADPWVFHQDYVFDLQENVLERLKLTSEEDVSVYNILTIPYDLNQVSINLLAPIIINKKTNDAMQSVLENTSYATKHPIKLKGA